MRENHSSKGTRFRLKPELEPAGVPSKKRRKVIPRRRSPPARNVSPLPQPEGLVNQDIDEHARKPTKVC